MNILVVEDQVLAANGIALLVKEIYKHVKAQQAAEQTPEVIDPRFVDRSDA